MPRLILSSLLAIVALTACSGAVEDTRPGQPVKQRQDAFKSMLRTFEPMGTMLRTSRYDADEFSRLAAQLATVRDTPWAHFGADTNYPPTKAKKAVWDQPEVFEQKREAFLASTEALLVAAQSRDAAQVRAAYDNTAQSCKSCHDRFRN
jgi:cytochrome c556